MNVLTDKTYKLYDYISRYTSFPIYYNNLDNKYVYGTTAQMSDDLTYTVHIVNYRETLDSIAFKYYGNPTFFWVICDFNHIQDPFIDLRVGQRLKIPSLGDIRFDI